VTRAEVALHDFAGHKVLLVFTQSGWGPCEQIVPDLNRLTRRDVQVLVVNRGDVETTRKWASETGVRYPVLVQNGLEVSKKYEAYLTPFAFLIDEEGVITSKGIVSSKQYLGYVLMGAGASSDGHAESSPVGIEEAARI
jgi:peroxiredoxin